MLTADISIFFFINLRMSNRILDYLMPLATYLGSGETIFFIALALLAVFIRDQKKRKAAVLLFAGLTLSYYFVYFLKNLIARPRPFEAMEGVRLLFRAGGFSFPSAHAAQAFMAAAVLSRFFRMSVLFFAVACIVAFSRVYIGVHYPSDVLAGALLGSAIGYALVRLS